MKHETEQETSARRKHPESATIGVSFREYFARTVSFLVSIGWNAPHELAG